MEIKRPMELAGLRSRLQRAQATETAIAVTGKRYDAVLDQIDVLHGVSKANVGQLETYAGDLKSTIERMTGGSNGAPNDDGRNGQEEKSGVCSVSPRRMPAPGTLASWYGFESGTKTASGERFNPNAMTCALLGRAVQHAAARHLSRPRHDLPRQRSRAGQVDRPRHRSVARRGNAPSA
jgi:hypothetical protein